MIKKYWILLVLLISVGYGYAQTDQTTVTVDTTLKVVKKYPYVIIENKLSLSVGIGEEYSLYGLRASYFFNRHFGLIGSINPTNFSKNSFAKLGVEWQSHVFSDNTLVVPYANVQVGAITDYSLSSNSNLIPSGTVTKRKIFYGATLAVGAKMNLIKRIKGYLSIGINFSFINDGSLRSFGDDFNNIYGTNYNPSYPNLYRFSLGYTYVISSSIYDEEEELDTY